MRSTSKDSTSSQGGGTEGPTLPAARAVFLSVAERIQRRLAAATAAAASPPSCPPTVAVTSASSNPSPAPSCSSLQQKLQARVRETLEDTSRRDAASRPSVAQGQAWEGRDMGLTAAFLLAEDRLLSNEEKGLVEEEGRRKMIAAIEDEAVESLMAERQVGGREKREGREEGLNFVACCCLRTVAL